jgi:hypothetical protein
MTVHRKNYDRRLSRAAIYLCQKGGNPLQRCLAAQKKQVVFDVFKRPGDQLPDAVRGGSVTVGKSTKDTLALCNPNRGIDDCFGRKSMNFSVLDAKDVTRQMKRTDLPTTVGKELVCPSCALTYLVDVVRGFCFSKDFRALAIFKFAPASFLVAILI